MRIEAMQCPKCGRQLEVNQGAEFTTCPACGMQLHIDYKGSGSGKSDMRTVIKDEMTGLPLGRCFLPNGWKVKGSFNGEWQSMAMPYKIVIKATSPDNGITVEVRSGEIFNQEVIHYGPKNPMLDRITDQVYRQATEPGRPIFKKHDLMQSFDYLNAVTFAVFQGQPLQATIKAQLPSMFGKNPQVLRRIYSFLFDYRHDWEMSFSAPVSEDFLLGIKSESVFRRYASGNRIRLVGADMVCKDVEQRSTGNEMMYGLAGMMVGTGHKGQYREWGSELLFFCDMEASRELEGTKAFMSIVESFTLDDGITKKRTDSIDRVERKLLMMQQQANAQNARLQQQLAANQARLQQTLAQNSRDMSNMIMDSWNKKMESDSRISQGYHEAIMGVNTYVRTDGSTVEHSVVSDHVYQNRYGDTVGFSGGDPGPMPGWTELERKDN